MAKGPTYRVPFRRRREGKTDYRRRLKLLRSRKPRVVIRKSNKYLRMQLVLSDKTGDKTLVSAMSSELKKYGHESGKCNIPTAYLTGLLFGKKAKTHGFEEGILDIGLQSPSYGSKVYAALKGATDIGLNLLHDPSIFPSEERIKGKHISEFLKDPSYSVVDKFEAVSERIKEDKEWQQEKRKK